MINVFCSRLFVISFYCPFDCLFSIFQVYLLLLLFNSVSFVDESNGFLLEKLFFFVCLILSATDLFN